MSINQFNPNNFKLVLAGVVGLFTIMFSVAAVSALTASTTISSNISKVISLLTTNGTVNADVVPTGSGAQTIASDTVTVSTNDASGYALTLADTDATTTLVSGANSVPASSGSQTTPIVEADN